MFIEVMCSYCIMCASNINLIYTTQHCMLEYILISTDVFIQTYTEILYLIEADM